MKNEMVNTLVNEVLNTTSKFAQNIEEILANLDEETAELIAMAAYQNGADSETVDELIEAIDNLPTEKRFELDELVAQIAYTRA